MPVATFLVAVFCGTDVPRCDVFLNMVLISVGVAVSSYGEIHFNMTGTIYQVMGIVAEALRLVLTQVLLQKKGLTLNPVTTLYYIAPCRYLAAAYFDFFLEYSVPFTSCVLLCYVHECFCFLCFYSLLWHSHQSFAEFIYWLLIVLILRPNVF